MALDELGSRSGLIMTTKTYSEWWWRVVACCLAVLLGLSTAHAQPALQEASGAEGAAEGESSAGEQEASPQDTQAMCLEQHVNSQRLRQERKLLEARDALVSCAGYECPVIVRRDCLNWLEELRREVPSLVFRVSVDGRSTADAKVFLDGELVAEQLDGRAIEVNPGLHTVRYEVGALPPLEQEVIVTEGERFRVVEGAFVSPVEAEPEAPAAGTGQPPPATEVQYERPVPMAAYVLGGVGVAALATGAGFGVATLTLESDMKKRCADRCTQDAIDALEQRALIADIALGVGAASVVAAGLIYFLRPERPVNSPEVDVAVGPHSVGASVRFTNPWF